MNAALKPDFARTHAFLGQKHRLLINNEWVEPRGGGMAKHLARSRVQHFDTPAGARFHPFIVDQQPVLAPQEGMGAGEIRLQSCVHD